MDSTDPGTSSQPEAQTEKALGLPDLMPRLRTAIFVAMLSAFGIEIVARYFRGMAGMPPIYPRTLSLVALALLCGSALYLIFLLRGRHMLKSMVSVATAFMLVSQLFAIARAALPIDVYAWSGPVHVWGRFIEGPLILAGVILLLTSFYLALLETISSKALLRREQADLYREIAQRKQAQQELQTSRDTLRNLSGHVERVRENERSKMAREIHDELGQTLTSLKIDLAHLRAQLVEAPENREVNMEILDSMAHQIDATVKSTRRIMSELHPSILDDLGLDAALEWLANEFEGRTAVPCSFSYLCHDAEFTQDQKTAIFRIVQECLTNIMRHADADSAAIDLRQDNGTVELCVRDNGRGFDVAAYEESGQSFGLLGMRERVTLLDGAFEMDSARDTGTRIAVRIPVKPNVEPA